MARKEWTLQALNEIFHKHDKAIRALAQSYPEAQGVMFDLDPKHNQPFLRIVFPKAAKTKRSDILSHVGALPVRPEFR